MAKFGMSMCVLGMAEELKSENISVNALWPKTAIATAAMEMLGGKDITKNCRKPDIMADAAYAVLTSKRTGQFLVDERILRESGVTDFDQYAVDPTQPLSPDFFLPEEELKSFSPDSLGQLYSSEKQSSGINSADVIFDKIKSVLSEDLVRRTSGIYSFHISGGNGKEIWYVDMKTGTGSVGKGDHPSGKADVVFSLDFESFIDMFSGKLKPTSAFLSGKLKLKGDMGLAMKLEKLMSQLKSKM